MSTKTTRCGHILTRQDADHVLELVGGFHDWFMMEARIVTGYRVAKASALSPEGGFRLALRLTNGSSEFAFVCSDVATLKIGECGFLSSGTIVVGPTIEIRLGRTLVSAKSVLPRRLGATMEQRMLSFMQHPSENRLRSVTGLGGPKQWKSACVHRQGNCDLFDVAFPQQAMLSVDSSQRFPASMIERDLADLP